MPLDFQSDFAQRMYNMAHERDRKWREESQVLEDTVARALHDLQALKTGDLKLKNLVVANGTWRFDDK